MKTLILHQEGKIQVSLWQNVDPISQPLLHFLQACLSFLEQEFHPAPD